MPLMNWRESMRKRSSCKKNWTNWKKPCWSSKPILVTINIKPKPKTQPWTQSPKSTKKSHTTATHRPVRTTSLMSDLSPNMKSLVREKLESTIKDNNCMKQDLTQAKMLCCLIQYIIWPQVIIMSCMNWESSVHLFTMKNKGFSIFLTFIRNWQTLWTTMENLWPTSSHCTRR